MEHSRSLFVLAAVFVLALFLGGCSKHAESKADFDFSVEAADGKHSKSSTDEKVHKKSSTGSKVSTALWNKTKDRQLQTFMGEWGETMGQKYTKYDGVHPLKTSVGERYPADFSRSVLYGKKVSIGWSNDGLGSNEYNIVAMYNYDGDIPPLPSHITYFFAFHDGKPVILVDEARDGYPQWGETKNTALRTNFERIAGVGYQESATAKNFQNKNDSAKDPKLLSVMIYQYVYPDIDFVHPPVMTLYTTDRKKYAIGQGSAVSTMEFELEGNNVRYWTLDTEHAESTVSAKQIEHQVSLQEVVNKTYSTPNEKQLIQTVANGLIIDF
ncbi:Lreu_0056 family protein [Companilactobacillus ginsenosidimutans]|uniref:Lreu_0056 family protein n=1 Tax=Companilactobacillus ginsenosidimutans TaxID=1007676 RepID=UPI00069F9E42|nr:DUF4767 domain-containing protein [Companilactobacillus ginsenosidimutans]